MHTDELSEPIELKLKKAESQAEIENLQEKLHQDSTPKDSKKHSIYFAIGIIGLLLIILLLIRISANYIQEVCFRDRCFSGIPDDQYIYNDFEFIRFGDLWFTQIARNNVEVNTQFHYGPRDVGDLEIQGSLNDTFKNSEVIYVTYDLSEPALNVTGLAAGELQLNLAQAFNIPLEAACMNLDVPACEIVPTITCANTNNATVIELIQGSPTEIVFDGNCVKIQGEDLELVRAVDKLLLRWYGIMK